MRKPITLVTGANGEIGHGLIKHLTEHGDSPVIALDLNPIAGELAELCEATIAGDILDRDLLERLSSEYEVQAIHHLAALLSTRAEHTPILAHRVNVDRPPPLVA